MRKLSTLSAAAALVLLSACASSNNIEGLAGGAGGCIGCHGGANGDTSGAPPFDVAGASSSDAVGAHTAHLSAGVTCNSCHQVPGQGPAPLHNNDHVDVIFGAIAEDPNGVASAAYDSTAHTCSNVYCHAPSTAPGGAAPPPWNAPAGAISGCGACHAANPHGGSLVVTQCTICHSTSVDGTGAVTPRPTGTHADGSIQKFTHPAGWATPHANGTTDHGLAANYRNKAQYPTGFEGCKSCHGSTLNNPIALNVPGCDGCHTGAATWRTSCTFCHGDPARSPVAARPMPPVDADGATSGVHVGAHEAHLTGGTVSRGVACTDCHGGTTRTLPSDYVHANGTTEVTLKRPGQNSATGSYDPATGTCNAYCHGNLPRNPKTPANTPAWTDTSGQSACGSCHAANGAYAGTDTMSGQHGSHSCSACHATNARVGCFACHPRYQRQINTVAPVVNLGLHVDGAVEVVGTTSGLLNNFNLSLTYTAPAGGNPASCATNCHDIGEHRNAGAPSTSVTPATW